MTVRVLSGDCLKNSSGVFEDGVYFSSRGGYVGHSGNDLQRLFDHLVRLLSG